MWKCIFLSVYSVNAILFYANFHICVRFVDNIEIDYFFDSNVPAYTICSTLAIEILQFYSWVFACVCVFIPMCDLLSSSSPQASSYLFILVHMESELRHIFTTFIVFLAKLICVGMTATDFWLSLVVFFLSFFLPCTHLLFN